MLNRVKWNYFNDFLYIMYFYLVMFAFAQTYDMQAKTDVHYASSIFAILFILMGVGWVVFLWVMVYLKCRDGIMETLFQVEHRKLGQIVKTE